MRNAPARATVASLLVLNLVFFLSSQSITASNRVASPETFSSRSAWLAPNNLGTFVHKLVDGRAVCLEALSEQAANIKQRDLNLPLTILTSNPDRDRPGLRIKLRATDQLNNAPAPRDAFLRAAAQWEALIQNQLTIVIDVDFGATRFGKPFGNEVIASTDAQVLAGNALYPAVRANLRSAAFSPDSIALFDALPARIVPTDQGASSGITASSANLRALNLIDPLVATDDEFGSFGPPPSIGFNSNFKFDFDATDGIDRDKLDFEAMVLHEIGHILGFVSCVGQREMDSSIAAQPAIWDLFRVRPDSIKSGFSASERVLSSGGDQSFYFGDSPVPLSTGKPDATGGDGRQASHWKDDTSTGQYLGVMDPSIGPGEHYVITDLDTAVLTALGYRANSASEPVQVIPLIPGKPQSGDMFAPPANLGALSHLQYSIEVPPHATELKVELNGNQDVDLFLRFGQRILIQNFHPANDYFSAGESGLETITVTPSSPKPLRAGTYFIAVANFGPGDATFTVTANVTGGASSRPPAIFNASSALDGDILDVSYTAVDPETDFASAEVSLLDESGRAVGQLLTFALPFTSSSRLESHLTVSGLVAFPTALRANLVLIDRDGNRSPEATVDFSRSDPGGLAVNSASFDESRLTIKTSGVAENLQVEINGRVVAPPRGIKVKGSGAKLIVKGDASQLGLRPGANRIRVKNGHGWSNILVLNL